MMLAIAVDMKTARNQLLARAALAHNQHRAVRVGDFADQVVDVLHLPARANDVFESVTVLQLLAQINVLAQRRLVIERPLHRKLELVDLKRLGHVIVRAHLHCLNRGFDRAVRSDQNHRRLPMMFPHMPEHVAPGHRLHFDVGDHGLRRDAVQLLDCFRRGIEWENLMALFPTESHDDFHHRGFVIDNYDFSHGKSQRGEYFNFEKKKAVLRNFLGKACRSRARRPAGESNFTCLHGTGTIRTSMDKTTAAKKAAFKDFTDRLTILMSKHPNLVTTTLSNIFTMRLIGNKTHGDMAEI